MTKDALFNLAEDLAAMESWEKAGAVLATLVGLDGSDGFARLRLARAYERLGRLDEALPEASRARADLARFHEVSAAEPDEVDALLENDRQEALREAAGLVKELEARGAAGA